MTCVSFYIEGEMNLSRMSKADCEIREVEKRNIYKSRQLHGEMKQRGKRI